MSLTQGIDNAYTITAQINKLRSMQESGQKYDPKAVEYALQQSFSTMLDGLMAASDDKDDDNNSIDPFSFMIDSNNQAIALQQQQDPSKIGQTSSTPYLDSLKQFENDPTALQNFLNTNDPRQNIF